MYLLPVVQVCFTLEQYETLEYMLEELRYFRDMQNAAAKRRADYLSIILVELLNQIGHAGSKLSTICQIGFNVIKAILVGSERGDF
jgi:hypothetical protein